MLLGFIRLSTRRGILLEPLTVGTCLATIDTLLNHRAADVVHPSRRNLSACQITLGS